VFRLKVALARAVGRLSRWSRRGGGTSLPGKLLLRLAPDAVARLGRQLERGAVIVSATNGKTTTAGMIASVLTQSGLTTAHNRAGANMPGGVATALLERTRGTRIREASLGLFEVDEAWVGSLVAELAPHTVILGNLFRDQLDRYGELEKLADGWAQLVEEYSERTTFVLNADDPLVADLGRTATGEPRPRVVYFGLGDRSHALPEPEHAFDAKHCRRCGAPYRYSATYLGHLGEYACPSCGSARPDPSVTAEQVELRGMSGARIVMSTPLGSIDLALPLPGLYNVYNALGATACCLSLGIGLEELKRGLESFATAFGRAERLRIGSRELSILLIKNPAGANEVFRTLVSRRPSQHQRSEQELDLWIALNDKIADGRDISWIWDTEFEMLAGHARRVVCSGTRAEELALRLKYAGLPADRVEVVRELEAALERSLQDGATPLYALPTYTALIELRELLAARGYARPYWEAR
jgi:UDP-N-acetylmuramyl tripeptide synthase